MVRHRPLALFVALASALVWLSVTARPAAAACHIAGFVESAVEGEEAVGTISLVVELQGRQPSCAGTVDVATVDGSAVAGEDYEALDRTLTFEEGDDRVETVDLVLLDDAAAEGVEEFTVELSAATGSISGTGGPATVSIADDDGGDDATGDTTTGTAEDDPAETTDDAATDTTGDDGAGDDAGDDDAGDAAPDTDDATAEGGGSSGLLLVVLVLVVLGLGAAFVVRGRST